MENKKPSMKNLFERQGHCKRCGRCCQLKTITKGMSLKFKFIFILINPILIFKSKCPYLGFDKQSKAFCKIYDHRPWFCRLYPAEPNDLIDEKCGYYFLKKK